MLSPFRYRSLVEVAVLLVSSPPSKPEGVLLADAAGGESVEGMSFFLFHVILCAFTPGPAETALARVRACTVILASARIACGDTTLAFSSCLRIFFNCARYERNRKRNFKQNWEWRYCGPMEMSTTLLRPFNVIYFPTCLLRCRNYYVIYFSFTPVFSFATFSSVQNVYMTVLIL